MQKKLGSIFMGAQKDRETDFGEGLTVSAQTPIS
jgi:hypothetical protein